MNPNDMRPDHPFRGGPAVVEPEIGQTPSTSHIDPSGGNGSFRVILYNDDWHGIEEVVEQVQKATAYSIERSIEIVVEADATGRAVCYHGSREDCHRVARVLREIRLQVEVDGG